jgi:Skp family chaperone for outer membrane proteins
MRESKMIVFMAIALALIPAVSVFAQQQAYKIVVVDSGRAFQSSTEGKKAIAQIQERESKIRADIQKIDDAILALQNRLNTGRLTMTQEALMAASADLEKKQTERKRYEEDANREFGQFRDSLANKIKTEMIAIIDALAKERGYDLVLDLGASGAAYFNPAIDVTEEIIRRYDISKAGIPPLKK